VRAHPRLMYIVLFVGSTSGRVRPKSAFTVTSLPSTASFQGWLFGPEGARTA